VGVTRHEEVTTFHQRKTLRQRHDRDGNGTPAPTHSINRQPPCWPLASPPLPAFAPATSRTAERKENQEG